MHNTDSIPTSYPTPSRRQTALRWIYWCCGCGCLFALLPVMLFFAASPRIYYIPSAAMEPTLHGGENVEGDRVLVSSWEYRFRRPRAGDLVVFTAPKAADAEAARLEARAPVENVLVKRVIGMPGDTIEVKPLRAGSACAVFRNGTPLTEAYIKEPMDMPASSASYAVNRPLTLAAGQYFVMGDNRNESNDSQYWGPLAENRIIGRVTQIVAPPERARRFP